MEIVKKCEWCHKTFIGQMVTARFCSSKCCYQAYRYKRNVQSGKCTPPDSTIDLSTLSRRVDEKKHFNDTLKDKHTKAGYDNSDVVTATLCWIDKEPVIDMTDISQVPAQAILIQNDGGLLTVQGLDDGTEVSVYGVNGTEAGTAVSRNGQAQVNTHLSPGSVAIVKIGEKSVKVVIK